MLLLLAIWLVGMPALVGQYVRAWVPEWLADIEATDDSHFEPGWFRSDLDFSPGNDVHARLSARHMPPIGLSWLRLDGEITTPHSRQPTRVHGHLDLNGQIRMLAEGSQLAVGDQPRFEAQGVEIRLDQKRGGTTRLQSDLTAIAWSDHFGNQLDFADGQFTMDWHALDDDQVGLALAARFNQVEQSHLELSITASPLNVEALDQLIEGFRQLTAAEPESMAQRMAFLTIMGAWQDLKQHGLEIKLERLMIGPDTRLEGQWLTATDQAHLTGSGRTDDLIEMLAPIIGLVRTDPPENAQRQARDWIAILVQERVLIPENGQFRLHYQSGHDLIDRAE